MVFRNTAGHIHITDITWIPKHLWKWSETLFSHGMNTCPGDPIVIVQHSQRCTVSQSLKPHWELVWNAYDHVTFIEWTQEPRDSSQTANERLMDCVIAWARRLRKHCGRVVARLIDKGHTRGLSISGTRWHFSIWTENSPLISSSIRLYVVIWDN